MGMFRRKRPRKQIQKKTLFIKNNKVDPGKPGQLGKAKFINIVDSGHRKTVYRFKKGKMPVAAVLYGLHSCLQYWFILPNSQVL